MLFGRKIALGLLVIGVCAMPTQACAADVLFTLTGPVAATFTLPQSPTPSATNVSVPFFEIFNFPATIEGSSTTAGIAVFSVDGPSLFWDSFILDLGPGGAKVFTGSVLTPAFTPGTYVYPAADLTQIPPLFPSTYPIGQETLTISAVPEPATWATMLLGFGAIGFAMRRKARIALPV